MFGVQHESTIGDLEAKVQHLEDNSPNIPGVRINSGLRSKANVRAIRACGCRRMIVRLKWMNE